MTLPAPPLLDDAVAPPAATAGLRRLGRFLLLQRLGLDSRSVLWLAQAPEADEPWLLLLPRDQPPDAAAQTAWLDAVRHAARIDHPRICPPQHSGLEQGWPWLAVPRSAGRSLGEHLAEPGPSPDAATWVGWLLQLLEGLAYLHEAGLAHHDLALHTLLLTPQGQLRLLGAGAGRPLDPNDSASEASARSADLLAAGLLLHRGLAGRWALDEPDLPRAVGRLGKEIVRLGWATPQPVPEALRAIVNRAVDREPARRYLGARSLARALEGWLAQHRAGSHGALPQLLERIEQTGVLPARPGLARRVVLLGQMEGQRLNAWLTLIVEDPALAFELLRQLGAVALAGHVQADEVATLRRAVQLLGMSGIRQAAQALRPWPGPLDEPAAAALARQLDRAVEAARLAERLCPADHDGEAAGLIALLQQLPALLLRYHLAEEARQIDALSQAGDLSGPDGTRPLSPEAAARAVLGLDPIDLGLAVARHWGLDETMQHAMLPLATDLPVRSPGSRVDMLRTAASAGGELAAGIDPARVEARYARTLGLERGELRRALDALRPPAGRAGSGRRA